MMKHLHEMKKTYMGFRFRITTTIWQFLKHFAKYISSSIKIIFMKSGWKQTLLGHYWAAAAKSCTKTCKISPAGWVLTFVIIHLYGLVFFLT